MEAQYWLYPVPQREEHKLKVDSFLYPWMPHNTHNPFVLVTLKSLEMVSFHLHFPFNFSPISSIFLILGPLIMASAHFGQKGTIPTTCTNHAANCKPRTFLHTCDGTHITPKSNTTHIAKCHQLLNHCMLLLAIKVPCYVHIQRRLDIHVTMRCAQAGIILCYIPNLNSLVPTSIWLGTEGKT